MDKSVNVIVSVLFNAVATPKLAVSPACKGFQSDAQGFLMAAVVG
jgi:hypothetical protein